MVFTVRQEKMNSLLAFAYQYISAAALGSLIFWAHSAFRLSSWFLLADSPSER